MKRYALVSGLAATVIAAALGCQASAQQTSDGHGNHAQHAATPAAKPVTAAIAVMHPTQGNKTSGTVRFTQEGGNKVKVVADIQGLQPNSKHGFHIHEFGDCSAPDATSAGGHYNPEGHAHAGPDAKERHAGDLGNLEANAQGNAHLEITLDNLTITGQRNPIIGRGVIIHAKADDLKSQPTGDAGGRIACGVIGVAKQ